MPRMALLQPNYLPDIKPFRFPVGAVLDVDEDTAIRWREHGVAEPAKQHEQTYKEKRRAEIAAELAALEDDEVPIVTLSSDSPMMRRKPGPKPRAGRAAPMPQSIVMSGPSAESVADDDGQGED